MAELTDTPAGRQWAWIMLWVALVFGIVVVSLTTWRGDATNTLHSSAQAWGFSVIGGVILLAVGKETAAVFKK